MAAGLTARTLEARRHLEKVAACRLRRKQDLAWRAQLVLSFAWRNRDCAYLP